MFSSIDPTRSESVSDHFTRLPDTMRAIDRLNVTSWVPAQIEYNLQNNRMYPNGI